MISLKAWELFLVAIYLYVFKMDRKPRWVPRNEIVLANGPRPKSFIIIYFRFKTCILELNDMGTQHTA